MPADLFHFGKKEDQPSDWTQQELAQFYRVEAALLSAGIAVETDRGISDEGDPWFVFCRVGGGDVIVHFARYGHFYLIASPAMEQIAHGTNFEALVGLLIERYSGFVKVRHDQKGNVVLHPATLLFALVMACLFKLDDAKASDAHGTHASDGLLHGVAGSSSIQTDVSGAGDLSKLAAFDDALMTGFTAALATAGADGLSPASSASDLPPWDAGEIAAARPAGPAPVLQDTHADGDGEGFHHQWGLSPGLLPAEDASAASLQPQSADGAPMHLLDHAQVDVRGLLPDQMSLVSPGLHGQMVFASDTTFAAAHGFAESANAAPHDAGDALGQILPAQQMFGDKGGELQMILKLVGDSARHPDGDHMAAAMSAASAVPPESAPGRAQLVQLPGLSAPSTPQAGDTIGAVDRFDAPHQEFQPLAGHRDLTLPDSHVATAGVVHVDFAAHAFSDASTVVLVGLAPMGH